FYLENLSEKWLPTAEQRWLSRIGLVVSSGLAFGLLLGLVGLTLSLSLVGMWVGMISGLVLGLIFGLIGAFMDLRPAAITRISFLNMSLRRRRAVRVAILGGLIGGLIFALILGFIGWTAEFGSDEEGWDKLDLGPTGLLFGLILGIICGSLAGFI